MTDEPINHESRKTRSAEPYRLPADLVSSGDASDLLNVIREAGEVDLELNFKSLDGQLTNSDRIIGNAAALRNINADPVKSLLEIAEGNFTE